MTSDDLVERLRNGESGNFEAAAEIERLRAQLAAAEARISALQGGAERYWEGRWRTTDAQLESAKKALEEIVALHEVTLGPATRLLARAIKIAEVALPCPLHPSTHHQDETK